MTRGRVVPGRRGATGRDARPCAPPTDFRAAARDIRQLLTPEPVVA
ncbi:hypothetical protein [Streptomyces africanus]|nr:hypothetical protein [Streptomyces africanus]